MTESDLTHKTAIVRPCRSADLANLDIKFKQSSPEGVIFPTKLAKQSKPGKETAEFFSPPFPHYATSPSTKNFGTTNQQKEVREQQILTLIKPYNRVAPSTIALA